MSSLLDAAAMFLAGLLTSLSPCLFPVLPAYLMYVAKRAGSALKTTLAFTAAMGASLAAYAALAATAGQAASLMIGLSPEIAAATLSTLLIALGVAQLSPARELSSALIRAAPQVRRLDAVGAAALGAFFALLAAPCASGPLLALVAYSALNPGPAPLLLASFVAGASLPFLALGATAQGVGPRLHRALAKSWLVRHSSELSGLLLVAYGAASLWVTGNPLHYIEVQLPLLRRAAQALWAAAFAALSIVLLYITASLGLGKLLIPPALTLALSCVEGIEAVQLPLPWPMLTGTALATALAWAVTYAAGRGRLAGWAALCTAAALAGSLIPSLANASLAVPLLEYALLSSSLGLSLALYALSVRALGLKRFS